MRRTQRRQQRRRHRGKKIAALLLGVLTGLYLGLRLALLALWRWGGPSFRRRVGLFNKRWTNRFAISILCAGQRHSPYALVHHVGRRSGRRYATPVVALRVPDAFVVPLVYGEAVDWYRNIRAAGGCEIVYQGERHAVASPQLADPATVVPAFPRMWQPLLRWYARSMRLYGISHVVRLSTTAVRHLPAQDSTSASAPIDTGAARSEAGALPGALPGKETLGAQHIVRDGAWTTPRLIVDAWRASHGGPASIAARQQARAAELVAFARERSPYYRRRYQNLPARLDDIGQLPPVTKPELMSHFDEWATDPAVTREGVERFMTTTTPGVQLYLDRYLVCTTSGVTGRPGIFLHDASARAVYEALLLIRASLTWLPPRSLRAMARAGGRMAVAIATEGHSVDVAWMNFTSLRIPWFSRRWIRTLSVMRPLADLVQELNAFRPAVLIVYPTVLALLTEEQLSGRLRIAPALVVTSAEWLPPTERAQAAQVFGCAVRDLYAATEFVGIAAECAHGALHVNGDWALLEPVDQAFRRVAPGQPSHTVLLTNLANRVQPLIRYDLGDSVTMLPDPCPCGSPLPAIRVEGRRDDILRFQAPDGARVPILPLALTSVVSATPGVGRYQLIQTAPATLQVRLMASATADRVESDQVWQALERRLRAYLALQGLAAVAIERAAEPPMRDPRTGKFRLVWCEPAVRMATS